MTGRTGGMLHGVTRIDEQRIVSCCGMTAKTGGLVEHHVGRSMINVMGVQVQGPESVVNITMTTGTVTTIDTAGSCCIQAIIAAARILMTGGTIVMDQVVGFINKVAVISGGVMAATGTVHCLRYVKGGNVINTAVSPFVNMTGLAVAARCEGSSIGA
jgi:hypothetical protein